MSSEIDHLLWGAPELEQGVERLEAMIGAAILPGGRHPGVGTHNALFGMEDRQYFEVLAPDPEQSSFTGFGRWVQALTCPRLVTWAARTDDIDGLAFKVNDVGMKAGEIRSMSRLKPDGSSLSWRLMTIDDHGLGSLIPFFIQWQDQHPCDELEPVARLLSLQLATPDPATLLETLRILELESDSIGIVSSPAPSLSARLKVQQGQEILIS